MGNCCCADSSEDNSPIVETSRSTSTRRSRNTNQSHRNFVIPTPREHGRSHTEFFRPTSNPMTPSPQQIEDDQAKMAQRQGIIGQIPTGVFDMGSKKHSECAICMIDFEVGDEIKYLPCMHVYHKDCVDDWLMRSLRCPACMEPVDAALLSSFDSFGNI